MVSEHNFPMGDFMEQFSSPSLSITQCVTLKLTSTNYLMWKTQFETYLSSQLLLGFIDGSSLRPSSVITVNRADRLVEEANPEFLIWIRKDQLVKAWIFGTLSESALRVVYGLQTAHEVWTSLAQNFNRISASRKLQLQRKFQNMTKLGKTMNEYLEEAKTVFDQLDSIGFPVTNQEKIYGILHGLGKDYDSISTNIEGAMDSIPEPYYDDVVARLLTFEEKQKSYVPIPDVTPHLAFNTGRGYTHRGNNFDSGRYNNHQNRGQNYNKGQSYGRGRGSYSTYGRGFHQQINRDNPSESNTRPVCQICNKIGHPAFKCYRRFDHSFNSMEQGPQPEALAAFRMTDQDPSSGHEWFPDTGATAHITNSSDQLYNPQPYNGSDAVIVGNGDFLPITHIGSSGIIMQQGMLPLKEVLVCPSITKSLLSVSKITSDYPCSFTFDSDIVVVKDKLTGQVLTQGKRHKDLYTLQDSPFQAFYSNRQQSTSAHLWHLRLGHPHTDVLQKLVKDQSISVTKNSPSICTACQLGKSCKLPFSDSAFTASRPLERLHCDIWGPAPVVSSQGFQYYVVFVDHFSRFTWLYPLKRKSDFFSTFVTFQKLVELQYQNKIASFQCDGGGEFTSNQFKAHLASCGIKQQVSCPYTPQQNGLAERKHRHITELGLTMLFQSQAPQSLWVEAFFTSVFLGNLLPSSVLDSNKSPFEVLTGSKPVYSSLRTFGTACYPYLRPYAQHKFDPKSLLCVFVGYNESYKGYRCFHPPSGKVYICRHVIFDEDLFPFQTVYQQFVPRSTSVLHSAWQAGFPVVPQTLDNSTSVPIEVSTEELVPRSRILRTAAQNSSNDLQRETEQAPMETASGATTTLSISESQQLPIIASDTPESITSSLVTSLPTSHPMITRSKLGIVKPNPKYALFTIKENYPEPKTVKTALKDAGWTAAMQTEIDTLHETETWDLVPPTLALAPLGCKWVFKTKLNSDGSLHRLKARLVAKGFEQEEGIDYTETYSPVVKTATVQLVLHLAVTQQWTIKQLDVTNAFLHGDLKETVYMTQPTGFEDKAKPDHLCKLKKAIYGLKQAPRAWFDKFSSYLLEFGFICSLSDPSLFVYHMQQDKMYLLLYVDDMILTGNNPMLLDSLLSSLNSQFRMKDLGPLHYFLGVQAHQHTGGLFLSQEKYTNDLLITAGMQECTPMPTPLPHQTDRVPGSQEHFPDVTYFRSLAGKLQYLTLTRPDIQFAVNFICQKMHQPSNADFQMLKRILRYLKGTSNMGINFNNDTDNTVSAYSDSDWASCKDTRRSTGGFCTFLGSNIISWSAKRHPTVSKSSTEAEYRTLSLAASELTWIHSLLRDLGVSQHKPAVLYCDNISAVYLTANPALHSRTKHFDIDFHYVRERVALGSIVVKHVPSTLQIADVFTKSLLHDSFTSLRYKLGVNVPSAPSLRGCINRTIHSRNELNTKHVKNQNVQGCRASVKKDSASDTYNRFKVLEVCDNV